ncbi:tRNA pseudouridine(55) synthase TruB [Pseudomonadota bacterium]
MGRRRKGRDVHGILLLDKPPGYSSNQAVQKVRWLFQARKAGHTGSLDPFATGMLPICLGEASKTAGFMLDSAKTYIATAHLGQATASGDIEGDIIREMPVPDLSAEAIEQAFSSFRGHIEQIPPMYSALKLDGQPLYKLAREGKEVERQPRTVTIHSLELLSWETPVLEFRVHCSKGTYVRTLAEDIAGALGSCAHLKALRRTEVGPFREMGMIELQAVERAAENGSLDSLLLPVDSGLENWPLVVLEDEAASRFTHGNPVPVSEQQIGAVRVYSEQDHLLGLGELRADCKVYPKRVFVW